MVVYRNDNCGPYRSKIVRWIINNHIEQGLTHPMANVIIAVDDNEKEEEEVVDDDAEDAVNVYVEVNNAPMAERANS
jgi:hypothetical protein